MSSQTTFFETVDWPLQKESPYRTPSLDSTSLSQGSEIASIHFSHYPLPPTPISSRPASEKTRASSFGTTDLVVRVPLQRPVHVAFSKGSSLFKLRYSTIDLRKDAGGNLKRIELSEQSGVTSTLIHSFPGTKSPIPHLEQPVTSSTPNVSRISFLEEGQTAQSATTLFQAQPQYTFETWDDCVNFQEKLLDQQLVFTAGIAEAKSKGRGEECISQNLRILRARNGRQVLIFFCNSQRKDKKRYISIPLDCIDHIEQKSKSRSLTLTLRPNFDLLAQLKTVSVHFLDHNDQKRFFALLCQGVGFQG